MGEIGLESKVEMKLVHIRSGIGLVANVVSRGPFKMNAVFSNMVVSLKRRMIAKTKQEHRTPTKRRPTVASPKGLFG